MSPVFLTSSTLPVPHGFFTRLGGVSDGPYASLNAGFSGGDDPARVRRNRDLAVLALGVAVPLLGLTQVHGAEVVRVTEPWAQGPRADALVTDRPGLALGVITADCAPVLFADARAGIVGAAHAGWRGAVAGVLEATLAAMVALGAQPARIVAAIGPCIGQTSYEVAADLRDAVLAATPDADACFAAGRPDRWHFDLAGYCALRLAGTAVDRLGVDTFAEQARFFSHRRRTLAGGGPIGHQISIIRSPLGLPGAAR